MPKSKDRDARTAHNLEAERAVLGACLINPKAATAVAAALSPGDFYRDAHRVIWRSMAAILRRRRTLDAVTLRARLDQRGEVDKVGGPAYVAALLDGVARSTNVLEYSRIVKELAIRRRIAALAAGDFAPDRLESELRKLAALSAGADRVEGDSWLNFLQDGEKEWIDMIWRPYIPSGFVTLVAGPPGAGKSLAMVSVVARMSRGEPLPGEPPDARHEPVLCAWLSLEENAGSILIPRFEAAGADLGKIAVPTDFSDCSLENQLFLDRLDNLAGQMRLIVIDSLSAWSSADLNKGGDVRSALMPLVAIMECHPECGLVVITHFRKAAASAALDRVSGSIQGGAAVRSVVTITKQALHGQLQHFWAHAKSNLAEAGPTHVFEPVGVDIDFPGNRKASIGCARWCGTSKFTADALAKMDARPQSPEQEAAENDDCAALLQELLTALDEKRHSEMLDRGRVASPWVAAVGDQCDRPSGRPKVKGWASRMLRIADVLLVKSGTGKSYTTHHFPDYTQRKNERFYWEKEIRDAASAYLA